MPRTELDVPPGVEYLSILDEDGGLDEELEPDLEEEMLLELHRVMLLSRRFDDRRLRWQRSGRIGEQGRSFDIAPRLHLPLMLAFDHRVNDGAGTPPGS